jgi:hypothetical protein
MTFRVIRNEPLQAYGKQIRIFLGKPAKFPLSPAKDNALKRVILPVQAIAASVDQLKAQDVEAKAKNAGSDKVWKTIHFANLVIELTPDLKL